MAVVYRYIGILTVGVVFFRSPGVFYSQDSFPLTFRPRLWETSSGVVAVGVFAVEALQRTHLQRPILKMSPTAGRQTSRGRNPENGRRRDFGRRRRHRQSGFQHTDRPRPSSPGLFNKDHNAGRESLNHLIFKRFIYVLKYFRKIVLKINLNYNFEYCITCLYFRPI